MGDLGPLTFLKFQLGCFVLVVVGAGILIGKYVL